DASRRNIIAQLSINALPEAKRFVNEVQDKFLSSFIAILIFNKADEKVKSDVEQIALKYRRLSVETKLDLERSFCIHNTLRWLNSNLN
ncbi:hypothetical protein PENTCL1PPCAC_19724, partial [Pristionchus entomophagus]